MLSVVNGAANGVGEQESFESGCAKEKAGGAGSWDSLASLAREALSVLTSSFPLLVIDSLLQCNDSGVLGAQVRTRRT